MEKSWKKSWNVMEFGFENCVGTLKITLNCSFPKPYRFSIQSLKAIGLGPRPVTFESEMRLKPLRP